MLVKQPNALKAITAMYRHQLTRNLAEKRWWGLVENVIISFFCLLFAFELFSCDLELLINNRCFFFAGWLDCALAPLLAEMLSTGFEWNKTEKDRLWTVFFKTLPLMVFGSDFSCFEETIFLGDGNLDTVEDRNRFVSKIKICCTKITPPKKKSRCGQTPPQKKFFTPPVPDTDASTNFGRINEYIMLPQISAKLMNIPCFHKFRQD